MERPILFSTDMVRAILAGKKTMTRRVVKGFSNEWETGTIRGDWAITEQYFMNGIIHQTWTRLKEPRDCRKVEIKCPWQPGDILWVRETWCNINKPGIEPDYYYLADCLNPAVEDYNPSEWKWKPSIHMPRKACRLFLKVTNVRVERLQEITPKDIRSEGLSSMGVHCLDRELAIPEWITLWDSINAKRGYGWDTNPWVWIVEFERKGT